MQSLNNQSNIPLRGNTIYIGSWDDILKYQNIQINLNASTNCEITYYSSNDKINIENTTFQYTANSNYFNSINSTSRYVYFTVRNTTANNQTKFNFSVLYRDFPVSGGSISSSGGSVQIADGYVSSNTLSYQIQYLYKNLTVYGSTDADCILTLELSDDDSTYYPTQYAYTVKSGAPIGFNIPSGSYNWVRFSIINPIANLILFLNYS